jgi:hypothetical protein
MSSTGTRTSAGREPPSHGVTRFFIHIHIGKARTLLDEEILFF